MKVLILAPQPFYQERGSPIAIDLLIRALTERGDSVDVLTYHEGEDRNYRGSQILRIKLPIRIRGIRPGFSVKKLICDVFLFFKFVVVMLKTRYDVVHAVEEGAFMALMVCPLRSTPFIYDMDSSMTAQIVDRFPRLKLLKSVMHFIESLPMRFATAVIPVCDMLADEVRKYRSDNILVLKDVSLMRNGSDTAVPQLREQYGLNGKIAMYIGNLESYQGIDLMLESFVVARKAYPNVSLVVIGGADADIKRYRRMAAALGIADDVHFLGKRPVGHIGYYMTQADVLLSPRTQGVNTPMKVYSYLHSGTPVVATDLPTHTQVMNDEIAMLASPDANSFGTAIVTLLNDNALRKRLAQNAHHYIEEEHNYAVFQNRIWDLYKMLEQHIQ
jgi:glycosyltransferase involved in cell wall biosynthesis